MSTDVVVSNFDEKLANFLCTLVCTRPARLESARPPRIARARVLCVHTLCTLLYNSRILYLFPDSQAFPE